MESGYDENKLISSRRKFLASLGLIAPGAFLMCTRTNSDNKTSEASKAVFFENEGEISWKKVRNSFGLNHGFVHMACLFLASNPKPVRDAINKYRNELDQNPAGYVMQKFDNMNLMVRDVIADFANVKSEEIALSDSTTMGTGLLINGLRIRQDQEMLFTYFDYYSTKQAMKYLAERTGAAARQIKLYDEIQNVSVDEMVENMTREIKSNTRLISATWVHSSTGLKVPVKQISGRIAEINASRDPADRVIFFVDGVHGFGVEDTSIADLGCHLFTAGTHKWLFGPRGTGFFYGSPEVQKEIFPTIPTFTDGHGWGGYMSPGGFKSFEHYWAVIEAFQFHTEIGKERIMGRTHDLARQLKEGLKKMDHVILYTPIDENLSSGIVSFDIRGMNATEAIKALHEHKIIASESPYNPSYVRFTPCIYNDDQDIERTLNAVHDLS